MNPLFGSRKAAELVLPTTKLGVAVFDYQSLGTEKCWNDLLVTYRWHVKQDVSLYAEADDLKRAVVWFDKVFENTDYHFHGDSFSSRYKKKYREHFNDFSLEPYEQMLPVPNQSEHQIIKALNKEFWIFETQSLAMSFGIKAATKSGPSLLDISDQAGLERYSIKNSTWSMLFERPNEILWARVFFALLCAKTFDMPTLGKSFVEGSI